MSLETLPEKPEIIEGGRDLGYDGLGNKPPKPQKKRWMPGEQQEIPPESMLAELSAAERGLEYHRGEVSKSLEKGEKPSRTDLNQLERYAEQMTSIVKKLRDKIDGRE